MECGEAQVVSPPTGTGQPSEYHCYVDFRRKLYEIYWTGLMQYPDISGFPHVSNATVRVVNLSSQMAETWAKSTLVDYGTDACIRCTHADAMPIVKIAHPNDTALLRLRYEFDMIRRMSEHSLPIAKVRQRPLTGDNGVYGYQLEALYKIQDSEHNLRMTEIQSAVRKIHAQGFSHGDLTPSNIMKDHRGNIVLIDCSFSGTIGTEIPSHIPNWVYGCETFCAESDERRLHSFCNRE